MSKNNHSVPEGFKRCRKGEGCVHPDGPVLPATLEYFKKCKSGRYGVNGTCKECCKKQDQAYYLANKDQYKKHAKEYYERHKETIKARVRAYEKTSQAKRTPAVAERLREKWRARHHAHKERRNMQERERRKAPEWKEKQRKYNSNYFRKYNIQRLRSDPDYRELRRISTLNRRARKRELPNNLTRADYDFAIEYFHGRCAVCGRQLNDLFGERFASMDHWIPLSSLECPGTVPKNMIPLCSGIDGCNNLKGAKDPLKWLNSRYGPQKAARIYSFIQAFFEAVRSD